MKLIDVFTDILPGQYVLAIMENAEDKHHMYSEEYESPTRELMYLFDWESSPEGYDFWNEVYMFMMGISELPAMPIDIIYDPSTVFYCDSHLYIMNIGNTGTCLKYPKDLIGKVNKEVKEKILAFLN